MLGEEKKEKTLVNIKFLFARKLDAVKPILL